MAESNEINNTIYDAVSNALENKNNQCITLLPSTTGKSAYDLAVDYGYIGTESMWLDTLQGLSAYEVAVTNGYKGTKTEWLSSIRGKTTYDLAVDYGYMGSERDWLSSIANDTTVVSNLYADAQSFSDFMSKPSLVSVPRRLAPPINTLNYYLDYLRALELVYSQQTGVVNVNGVQVKVVTQAIKDALNSAAIDNNTQVDTLITATPQYVGSVARTQADVNSDTVNAKTFGVYSNADSAGIKKAIDYATSNNTEVTFDFDVIIKVPSHATNLNNAILSITGNHKRKFTVLIETGHKPVSGIEIKDSDYSNITINAQDALVTLSPNFDETTDFIKANNATAPTLNCLIDANGKCRYALNIQDNSNITVSPNCGVKNSKERGVYLNNCSKGLLSGSVWTGVGSIASSGIVRAAWISRGSTLIAEDANFSNSAGDGMYVSRASTVHAMDLKIANTNGIALWAHRTSRVTAHSVYGLGTVLSTTSSAVEDVVRVARGSTVALNADAGTAPVSITQRGTGFGVVNEGSIVDLSEATVLEVGVKGKAGVSTKNGGTTRANQLSVNGFAQSVEVNGGTLSAPLTKLLGARSAGALGSRGTLVLSSSEIKCLTVGADLVCTQGSTIHADKVKTTSSTTNTPVLTDTSINGFQQFNQIGARGIIYS